MTGREDSWNYANDDEWFAVLSAHELVFACGEEHPTPSAQRALGLLFEIIGPATVCQAAERVENALSRSTLARPARPSPPP